MAKLEKKLAGMESKYRETLESLEIMQSKLAIYEENPSYARMGKNELSDFQKMEEENLAEKVEELQKHIRLLETENAILRETNASELSS